MTCVREDVRRKGVCLRSARFDEAWGASSACLRRFLVQVDVGEGHNMASTASKVPRTGLTSRAATAATAATIPTLASLGVKINRSKVVDADTGQVYRCAGVVFIRRQTIDSLSRADVQFGASSSRNERGHIAYEGVVQASQNVGVETFLSPLPPPELGVKQHWSEQKHETEGGEGLAERKGYGLERRRLPLGTKETENGSTILVRYVSYLHEKSRA